MIRTEEECVCKVDVMFSMIPFLCNVQTRHFVCVYVCVFACVPMILEKGVGGDIHQTFNIGYLLELEGRGEVGRKFLFF